jgi:hypothetical protein
MQSELEAAEVRTVAQVRPSRPVNVATIVPWIAALYGDRALIAGRLSTGEGRHSNELLFTR